LETKTFADLGLSPKVQAAITAAGYVTPTPIQAAAIPVAVTGRDVLGIAQTGTGKTASFVLPMITRLETGRARARMPRSLILAPTRELAAQVAQSFEKYGVNHKLSVALLIGGVSMDDQVKKLDRGVDVLIATPGRLLDHFGRGRVMLMGVEILVIDEADRMLDMGFIPDIEKICKLLPPRRQTLFFSATMPPEITRLVNQFLTNPERIEVAKPATTAKTITQRFVYCPNGEDWAKREVLRNLIRNGNVKNAIIFCNRKRDVAVLFKSLAKHGFNAGALHGDMDQTSRMETLDKFRNGEILLLAASDVAARGLDIPDVSHVFNFDLPWAADDYVHRIGRTGRAGREGYSASLVSPDDLKFVKEIEKITSEAPIWLGEAPTEEDIAGAGKRRRGRGGRGQSQSRGHERPAKAPRGASRGHREQRASDGRADEAPARHQSETKKSEARQPEADASPARGRPEQPQHSAGREGPQRSRRVPQRSAPKEQPTIDAWTDEPRPPKRGEQPPEKRQPPKEPPHRSQAPQKSGERLGFAENVPAFMRKPPRPLKVPGRG
jgi:superfamily II DNA/RNA helicase